MNKNKFVQHEGIYLLNHSVGLPPANARREGVGAFFDPWEHDTPDVWPKWFAAIEAFRTALGNLLNSDPKNFCPQTNVSSTVTKILYAIPTHKDRKTILLTEHDFPSIGFALGKAEAAGFRLKFISKAQVAWDLNVWDAHLTPDVGLALVTHVHSNTSRQQPVKEIVSLVREREAVSIVDIAQSAGVVPIDFSVWNPDFVVGSCVKWLCGGPGAGHLWANPDLVDQCKPIDVGWFSHAEPFEFDIHNFRYADGVLRFWGGTPSVLPFVVARNSIDLIDSIGVDTIRAHNVVLSDKIIDAVDENRLRTPRDAADRGGTVVLNYGNRQPEIVGRLEESGVRFDSRPAGLRLSPHIYNTAEEIDQVIDCLCS